MSANKRHHIRIVVTLRVKAECKLGRANGTTKNLSVGGMYMLTDAKFPAGTEVSLVLDHKMTSLDMRATVTHVREDGLGLKFVDPPQAVVGELVGVIDDILSSGADVDGSETILDGSERSIIIRRGVLEFAATLIAASAEEVTIEASEMPDASELLVLLVPARTEGAHVREIIGATATVTAIAAPRFKAALNDASSEFVTAASRVAR